MATTTPYHEGELAVQKLAGEAAMAARVGAIVGDALPARAIPFLAAQEMLVLGSVDAAGTPWASLLPGRPGFVGADDAGGLVSVDLTQAARLAGDVLWGNLAGDARVGVLAIDLSTRRRVRINGRVTARTADGLEIEAEEAYGNCPKYIQQRTVEGDLTAGSDDLVVGDALTLDQAALIDASDTVFVATVNGRNGGVDASHRGGRPGFVERIGARTLRIPDFPGNSMFNTLGNIHVHSRAGLLFVDFESGRLLQVAGEGRLRFDLDDPDGATGGSARFWELEVESVREMRLGGGLDWTLIERSPFNPGA